jgi:antitoxin VapB
MTLNIKNPETHRLATELARLTGETLTQAVTEALRERLERVSRQRQKATAAELLAIGRRCAAHLHMPATSVEHATLLYDEQGLPS